MLKHFLFVFMFFHFTGSFAQKDSANFPSLKIFINGSISLINGWKPTTGKFYPTDWHSGSEVNTHSKSYGFGLMISKRVAKIFYISAGIGKTEDKFDKFRKTPYPVYPALYDTSFYGYKLKTFRLPVFIQVPVLISRARIFLCTGFENEFTYSESYFTTYSDYTTGTGYRFEKATRSSVTRFTGTKLFAALDLEFNNTEGPILFLLGLDYLSPTIISNATGSYFLRHGSEFLLRMGFGFSFGKKKPQQNQYT